MPRYRVEIRDPDDGALLHTVTHTVFGFQWYEALVEFARCYGFRRGDWRLRAVEVKDGPKTA